MIPLITENSKDRPAQLNRNRFILVDTKLSPKRADDGEVIVDADFSVKDSMPISANLDISNNGTPQSSGWRSKLGVEMWEPFNNSDRISVSYSTDPLETSELQSYSLAYQASYGSFSHALFGGFSESEYSNQVSKSDLFLSNGMYLGFLGSYGFDSGPFDGISLTYGLTYIKSASQSSVSGFTFSETKVPLVLPRHRIHGQFSKPLG